MVGKDADVIVVGSGAGGAAVAGELGRAGRSVIVLEAGDALTGPRGVHARNADPGAHGVAAFSRYFARVYRPQGGGTPVGRMPGLGTIHAVGGMLTSWTNNTPTHDITELPDWLDFGEWNALVERARSLLHSNTRLSEDDPRTRLILDRVRGVVGTLPANRSPQPMPVAARFEEGRLHWSAADDLLRGAGNIRIASGRAVRRIRERSGRVEVEVFERERGNLEVYSAADVVVAAGTVGSAQLISASQLDAGPALGAYLMEHVAFGTRIALRPELHAYPTADGPGFGVWVPVSAAHPWSTQVTRHFLAYTDVLPDGTDPTQTADLIAFCPVEPRAGNSLSFDANTLDSFGLPSVAGVIELSARDRMVAADALREQFLLCAELGDLDAGWGSLMVARGGSTHVSGSCRMGTADDGTSVVRPDGRLWRHEHIYVAGNAVLSTANGGNPTLSTIAFALHTADGLLGRPASILRPHPLEVVS